MEVIYSHPWLTIGFIAWAGIWLGVALSQINNE